MQIIIALVFILLIVGIVYIFTSANSQRQKRKLLEQLLFNKKITDETYKEYINKC